MIAAMKAMPPMTPPTIASTGVDFLDGFSLGGFVELFG